MSSGVGMDSGANIKPLANLKCEFFVKHWMGIFEEMVGGFARFYKG